MIRKFLFLLTVVLAGAVSGFSQSVRSPFSTFGLGESYGNALIQTQGMAGVGVSQPQYWYLNNQNPALLVNNNITVFQAGAVIDRRKVSGDSFTNQNTGGALNYLATAFPIKVSRWTTAVGLMPMTSVKYDVSSFEYFVDENTGVVVDTATMTESGMGGLTQLYWSNGVRLNRNFSVGLKAAYVFGPIESRYSNQLDDEGQSNPYIVQIRDKMVVKDFLFTAGLSFVRDSLGRRNNYQFSAGATYGIKTMFNASRRYEKVRMDLAENVIEKDTLLTNSGKLSIPGELTIGASISRGSRWSLGTEFTYSDWSQFRSLNRDDEGLGQSWRAAIGGELTPDPLAGESYLKRVTYRVGLSYEQTPVMINGAPVNDFGINFGFSLPAGRSSLDLAFRVGKRGDKGENLLEETYFRVYFGITFNDQWFIKRKFD